MNEIIQFFKTADAGEFILGLFGVALVFRLLIAVVLGNDDDEL
jgi:hypothetical protein